MQSHQAVAARRKPAQMGLRKMSQLEAVQAFRQNVNDNQALQGHFLEAYNAGPEAVVELAARHGFKFSVADYQTALAGISEESMTPFERSIAAVSPEGDELSAYELELINAGSSPSCQIGGGNTRSNG
jgi:predicted ribosomally synthesized peptide with nif11-like leader